MRRNVRKETCGLSNVRFSDESNTRPHLSFFLPRNDELTVFNHRLDV